MRDGIPAPTREEREADRQAAKKAERARADARIAAAKARAEHARAAEVEQAERAREARELAAREAAANVPGARTLLGNQKPDPALEAALTAEHQRVERTGKLFRARIAEMSERAASERKRLGVDE